MGSKTNTIENAVLNHLLGTTEYVFVGQVYLGLYTVSPGEGASGTEVTGGAYARRAIDFNAASGGSASQSVLIDFPQATASWGTIVAWGVLSALTSGTLLYWGDITPNKAITTGDIARFNAAAIVITED